MSAELADLRRCFICGEPTAGRRILCPECGCGICGSPAVGRPEEDKPKPGQNGPEPLCAEHLEGLTR